MDDFQTRLEQWVNAADIYQREVSKLRAERDALYQLALEASSLFDDIDAGEPGYMEAVDAWRSRIENSREGVGSASAPRKCGCGRAALTMDSGWWWVACDCGGGPLKATAEEALAAWARMWLP